MELTVKKTNEKIGVAVSGGADSMALLHAYCSIGQDVLVVNVEHGIRGDASKRDTDFVRSYCLLNNIPFLSRSVDVPSSLLQGESTETCARRLRYAFFDELLEKKVVQKIALAHHADDNAETVLMRLFRGTGIRGLVGIGDRENYIRPLIHYTKKQIEEYVSSHRIPFVTDETNYSSDYTRNYIRNELVPVIKNRFPDFSGAIARLSSCALDADEYLRSVCPVAEVKDGKYYLKNFFGYPKILQEYAIMGTVRSMGHLQDFETRHVESILSLAEKPNNTEIDLPFSLSCVKFGDGVIFSKKVDENFFEQPFEEEKAYVYKGKTYRFEETDELVSGVSVDPDKLPVGCVIRERKDGDVFKRVNGKTKLLSDFLNEKKLSKPDKDELLVLCSGSEVYAVLGLETSDKVKITEETKRILRIIKE